MVPSNTSSDQNYCHKLTLALINDDQYSIESLCNASGAAWTIEWLLMNNKIDPNMQGARQRNALIHWAARAHNTDILDIVCADARTNCDIKNKNGCTALSFAAAQAKVFATQVLLDHKANPNMVNHDGHTPLHSAIMGYCSMGSSYRASYSKIITLLIADPRTLVNKLDGQGKTSLHYAVLWGDTVATKLLLSCGRIDHNIMDLQNKTALDYARENDRQELIKLLIGK